MVSSLGAVVLFWFHCVVVQASPINFLSGAYSGNNTILTPRLQGQFRIENCANGRQTAIQNALVEAQQIMEVTYQRTDDLYDLLDFPTPEFETWELEEWSTFDTFETIYGKLFDTSSGGVIADALERVNTIRTAALNMANQLANPAALDLDIFCNDDWLTETDDFGDPNEEGPNGSEDPNWDFDSSGNNFGWIDRSSPQGYVSCGNPSLKVIGFCNSRDVVSIITMCNGPLDSAIAAEVSLTADAQITYNVETESLQYLVRNAVSSLLIHELSHATAVMGVEHEDDSDDEEAGGILFDNTYPNPSGSGSLPGYGWDGVTNLVGYSPSAAVRNADSFSFYSGAMYLRKNTWFTGMARPLEQYSASGLTFTS